MKNLLRLMAFTLCFIFTACEDDPLLDPDTSSEADKGSYGALRIPELDDSDEAKNPEIF